MKLPGALATTVVIGLLTAAPAAALGGSGAINSVLTSQQEALLGCGPFYGVECDPRLDPSALLVQLNSDPFDGGFEGTGVDWAAQGVYRPGTVVLPGAFGPGGVVVVPRLDPGNDVVFHPVVDELDELAALSWNALLLLAGTSVVEDDDLLAGFEPDLPFRQDGCSFRRPSLCANVEAFFQPGGPGGPAVAVPEPGAALLFALGFGLVAARLRR